MASGVSTFGAQRFIAALFGLDSVPAGFYIALCGAEPGAGMNGASVAALEPVGGGYARQAYGVGAASWSANGGYVTNLSRLAFPTATADWGRVTHFALCSAASGGDLYAWGDLRNPQYIQAGFAAVLSPGSITIGLAAATAAV